MADVCRPGSLQACVLRAARLDTDGTPLTGPTDQYVTDAFASVGFSPQYEAGDDFRPKNGCGVVQYSHKAPDSLVRYDLTLQLMTPDPLLIELLVPGTDILTFLGEPVGFVFPDTGEVGEDNGVSLEVWTKAIVGSDRNPDRPWYRWPLTKTKNWRPTDFTLENNPLLPQLQGIAVKNSNWGNGPADDWDTLTTVPITEPIAAVLDFEVPEVTCDYAVIGS